MKTVYRTIGATVILLAITGAAVGSSTGGIAAATADKPVEKKLNIPKHALAVAYKYEIPPGIFFGLIYKESRWDHAAVSKSGAIGLTQLMPFNITAMGYKLSRFKTSPVAQLEAGARYLKAQHRRFGRWDLALAAYHAGPGAVKRAGGIPKNKTTQRYVSFIMSWANKSVSEL